MGKENGVIRIGRKGRKKFAIGDEDDSREIPIFEVDVVVAFQSWIGVDQEFRDRNDDRSISVEDMAEYHLAAVKFVADLSATNEPITTAEALDFIARLREQYDEVADFFQPRSRADPDSPGTSAAGLRFLVEES